MRGIERGVCGEWGWGGGGGGSRLQLRIVDTTE